MPAVSAFAADTDSIVVTVNGYEITAAEINYELGQLEQQAMISGEQQKVPLNYAHMEELRATVIETLINKHLLLQECRKRNVNISTGRIEENLLLLRQQFPTAQQYYDFLAHSEISETKLRDEIHTALKIDTLAEMEIEKQGGSNGIISEEDKQKALAALLHRLHETAVIEY